MGAHPTRGAKLGADAVSESERLRRLALWLALARLLAVVLAAAQILLTDTFPPGFRGWAWFAWGALAIGAVGIAVVTRLHLPVRGRNRLGAAALTFDAGIVFAFMLVFSFQDGQPTWAMWYLPIVEGALRFRFLGGVATALATFPLLAAAEVFRADRFDPQDVRIDVVATRGGFGIVIGIVFGRVVSALVEQGELADQRADEAERLRDELGRRVDLLEAANRCARALGSSLDVDEAFSAFIRELRGLVPFDRAAIVLAEDGRAQVMAVAGVGVEEVFPPGTSRPVSGSVLEEVLTGRTVYREDMSDRRHPEEDELLALGLRCRLVVPLLLGARTIGMIALVRREPSSFAADERELVTLLGRLVATGVQNIHSYEAERTTVEELRRLSALRADFVSLVSHELRSPMAAVIGSARTLQERWRQLTADQRESFLALIADETSRLATLVGDVLDTSRIEAGTFSFTFEPVDVGQLVQESVAHAALSQDEVAVRADVETSLPPVRGDRERLRQVLANLIENAVKYSRAGEAVDVLARAENSRVEVTVRDTGPGIPAEQQKLIFEKFGRARVTGGVKPGTGLGLFIARSIAEAHGGSLEVRSTLGRGSAFTLALPLD
jgi:signal transduction histidine kinase